MKRVQLSKAQKNMKNLDLQTSNLTSLNLNRPHYPPGYKNT